MGRKGRSNQTSKWEYLWIENLNFNYFPLGFQFQFSKSENVKLHLHHCIFCTIAHCNMLSSYYSVFFECIKTLLWGYYYCWNLKKLFYPIHLIILLKHYLKQPSLFQCHSPLNKVLSLKHYKDLNQE